MSATNDFQPQWASPPGDTISLIVEGLGMALSEFFKAVGLSYGDGRKLLNGCLELSEGLAGRVAEVCGPSQDFWLAREAQYREDLEREAGRLREETLDWMGALPLKDMVKKRWIPPRLKGEEKLAACLDYFGVDSYPAWKQKYNGLLHSVAFRTSNTFEPSLESVLVWLRQGEMHAEKNRLGSWNRDSFLEALPVARELTRERDPQVFLPKIKSIFSPAGVSVVVAPAPTGCRASGAVFFAGDDHAVILLSFRYLSDDHFWFTFFHECGHLAMHADRGLFLEGAFADGQEEVEANEFAERILIPDDYVDELRALSEKSIRGIYKFAKKVGVSPGIVVGQLQHHGLVRHSHLNKIKNRYSWRGT